MKNLLILLLLVISSAGMSQKIAEISFSNEDKAVGLNYIDLSNRFVIGAESGLYRYDRAKIEHQKYKAGFVFIQKEILKNNKDLIWTSSICYNHYNEIYNYDQVKKMPEISFEFAFRAELVKGVYAGANFDIVHGTGGFNIGFLIFK